ncbi:hypothetical protein AB0O08_27840 [Streptomyces anulatus]|uniref:ATP-binding protein n=1 Tax=Streptomyces anulatus TaxID=1892 RepID=UPI00342EC452
MSSSQLRRFPRRRTSVGTSRAFVAQILREWQLTDLIDDIELCASELATNALLHGVPPELAAEFGVDEHVVGKTVWAAFKRPATP